MAEFEDCIAETLAQFKLKVSVKPTDDGNEIISCSLIVNKGTSVETVNKVEGMIKSIVTEHVKSSSGNHINIEFTWVLVGVLFTHTQPPMFKYEVISGAMPELWFKITNSLCTHLQDYFTDYYLPTETTYH